MRKAGEKERKTKVSEVAKRAERRKKSNGEPECPLIRGKQQRGEGKQRALGKEKAAATRLERGKRKKTNLGFSDFRMSAERERERWRVGSRGASF
jgi:hypothetical protein